jgi:uncharacterized membrane protein
VLRAGVIVVNAILVIAYPIAVFWGLTHLPARSVSLIVLALMVPGLAWRFRRADRSTFWSMVRLPIAIGLLILGGVITDDRRFVLAMPVLINAVLLIEFGSTLRAGATPMIERFARMQEPELDHAKRAHCRRWTARWCVFFVINGAIAAALAIGAPLWWWTVYTGAIAYALIGAMFGVEWLERRARFGAKSTGRPGEGR